MRPLSFILMTLSLVTNATSLKIVERFYPIQELTEEDASDSSKLWQKQIYDYGRGSKYNKPPIRTLAEARLDKQKRELLQKCLCDNGVPSFKKNYVTWGCCSTTSSRPCLYPGYPYPQDPGGCVAKVGIAVSCDSATIEETELDQEIPSFELELGN